MILEQFRKGREERGYSVLLDEFLWAFALVGVSLTAFSEFPTPTHSEAPILRIQKTHKQLGISLCDVLFIWTIHLLCARASFNTEVTSYSFLSPSPCLFQDLSQNGYSINKSMKELHYLYLKNQCGVGNDL